MRPIVLLSVAALLALAAGCESSDPVEGKRGDELRAACLDRPGLARPPAGQLPCELLPPGFSLGDR